MTSHQSQSEESTMQQQQQQQQPLSQHLALHADAAPTTGSLCSGELQQQHHTYVYKNQLPRRRRKLDPNRRVTFATEAIAHRNPLTVEEASECWYTRDQLASFKHDRKDTVRALKAVNFDAAKIDLSRYCLRGYEAYSSVQFNRFLQKQRILVSRSVLAEQRRQKQVCVEMIMDQQRLPLTREQVEQSLPFMVFDTDSLCEISMKSTAWAKERGVEMAMEDALNCGYPPMTSIVVDDVGDYYNEHAPANASDDDDDDTSNGDWGFR